MKKVRLITEDEHNGKLAISRTPLSNRFFFEGAWHEINVTTKPEIIKDASILETTHAIYSELTDTFDISNLVSSVEIAMWDHKRRPRPATIDRRLRDLKETNLINYEVIDSSKGTYRKLPVISKTCDQQGKIEFKPDIKKQFIEFLKAEGAYKKYMKAFHIEEPGENIWVYLKEKSPIYYISIAFIWYGTPDGWAYWNNIDKKWMATCK